MDSKGDIIAVETTSDEAWDQLVDLYNDKEELFKKIDDALWGFLNIQRLKCKAQMNNFYNKIIKEMTEEVKDYPF